MATLSKQVVVQPAVAAVTVGEFELIDVQENYGYVTGDGPGRGFMGRGRLNSVTVTVSFPTTPPSQREITAWEGDAYLAVRGLWTDATLVARIAEILEAE